MKEWRKEKKENTFLQTNLSIGIDLLLKFVVAMFPENVIESLI